MSMSPLKHPGKLNTLIQTALMLPSAVTRVFSCSFALSMSTHHILECGIHILLLGSAV